MNRPKDQFPQDSPYFADKALLNEPPCYSSMQARLLEYGSNRVTVAIPVLGNYLNPAGSMQGGFITAAFDNVFGPLCLSATGTPRTAALHIATTYHRPIFEGDSLVITAAVKNLGNTAVYMEAEAYNKEGKHIASASSNYIIRRSKQSSEAVNNNGGAK
ncbi:MAG: PaaI family thioesterase [Syntrophomonas sp.]